MNTASLHGASGFTTPRFLKAAIPSYLAPFASAGIPALLLGRDELFHDSYSVIALPSLLATVIVFVALAHLQKRQILLVSKVGTALLMGMSVGTLSLIPVYCLGLWPDVTTISSSAFIGAVIVSLTNPLKKSSPDEER